MRRVAAPVGKRPNRRVYGTVRRGREGFRIEDVHA